MLLHSRDDTASSMSGPMGPLVLRVFKRAKIFVRLTVGTPAILLWVFSSSHSEGE